MNHESVINLFALLLHDCIMMRDIYICVVQCISLTCFKVEQIRQWKDRRSKLRQLRDEEDQELLNAIDEQLRDKHTKRAVSAEHKIAQSERPHKSNRHISNAITRPIRRDINSAPQKSPVSTGEPRHLQNAEKWKSNELEKLSTEYNNLRDQEKAIRDEIDKLELNIRQDSAISNISDDISLPPTPKPAVEPTPLVKLDDKRRHNQEVYNHHLSEIHHKYRELEQQRGDIIHRMQDLSKSENNSVLLVNQLKLQEDKNQEILFDLKRQVDELKNVKSSSAPPVVPIFPMSHGGSLVEEISSMKLAYVQNGGNDPNVLAQLNDMLTEAQAIENGHQRKQRRSASYDPLSLKILEFEIENQRLLHELDNVKVKEESDDEKAIKQMHKEHMLRMLGLQHEMEVLKHEALIQKLRRELKTPPKPENPPAPRPPPPHDVPYLMQYQSATQEEAFLPSPYDPASGFVVFYDFVMGLDPAYNYVRLVVGLFNGTDELGSPIALPIKECYQLQTPFYGGSQHWGGYAITGAKQPVQRCRPSTDLALVVEIQASSQFDEGQLKTIGWTKILLFDDQLRVVSGRWKIPLRIMPIRKEFEARQLNSIPQCGLTELSYRVVNYRDADLQSAFKINTNQSAQYRYPPQSYGAAPMFYPPPLSVPIPEPDTQPDTQPESHPDHKNVVRLPMHDKYSNIPPPPSAGPPPSSTTNPVKRPALKPVLRRSSPTAIPPPSIPPSVTPTSSEDRLTITHDSNDPIVFHVDRVKHAPDGEANVRVTVYHRGSGDIAHSSSRPISFTTHSVSQSFKQDYFVYGREEDIFEDVQLQKDMVVMVRFYLRQRIISVDEESIQQTNSTTILDDEYLVAWAAMPLINIYSEVDAGSFKLPLYHVPVPDPGEIHRTAMKNWKRYGNANVRIGIYLGYPPREYTSSIESDDGEPTRVEPSEQPWVKSDKETPLSQPFQSGDGFDLYIDAARFLPDPVTISRVAGRVFDRKYNKIGKDISTGINLNSDIYNPVYDYRLEFRDIAIPPSATLLIKLYTIDKMTKALTVVGYGALNIFVESASFKQPSADAGGVQVSLNEGAHQLRIYHQSPDALQPLYKDILKESHRYIPCATLLIRIVRAAVGPNGKPLEAERVPQSDWSRLGLVVGRPDYSQGVYTSMECEPTSGESNLFKSLSRRPYQSVRDSLSLIADGKQKNLGTDAQIENFIRTQLTRLMDTVPLDLDITYITSYRPKHGLKVSIDGAINLPWSQFTHAMICFNPPGAFYYGKKIASYDKPKLTRKLDFDSEQKSPTWNDGYLPFLHRSYHGYLTLIIHLQEISVTIADDNYKYSLQEQAWTAVQVFKDRYASTSVFQLPLYEGAPTQSVLQRLQVESTNDSLRSMVESKMIQYAGSSSVFVRLCDGRRSEELEPLVDANMDYLPADKVKHYLKRIASQPLHDLIPQGKDLSEFQESLSNRFHMLVDRLLESDDILTS